MLRRILLLCVELSYLFCLNCQITEAVGRVSTRNEATLINRESARFTVQRAHKGETEGSGDGNQLDRET